MAKTSWDAQRYDTEHDFVARYGIELLELLKPLPGELILDLGCGTGTLTHVIARAGSKVIGIDSSQQMIKKAHENFPEVEFIVADGHNFKFDLQFDAVFSNAALHWMTKPQQVIACVWQCLKNNSRFVLEMGGLGNVKILLDAITDACKSFMISDFSLVNYYPSIAEYSTLLEKQGFRVTYAILFDRPTKLQGKDGLRNWVRMFRNEVVAQIPQVNLENFFQAIEEQCRPHLYYEESWWADYVRLRMIAIKPPVF